MMNLKLFEKVCKIHNQKALKIVLEKFLEEYYPKVYNEDGFLYVPSGNVDVMLTAHMDTVHDKKCKKICEVTREKKKALWSPQGIGGDDRCGVFMIMEILRNTSLRPSIVFCEDEEIGGVGSKKFGKWIEKTDLATNVKYIIELDRRNATDAVFYDCGNEEFIKYITTTTGYKEEVGTFSDIGNISPVLDVASVNLSCGYYKEHTLDHYVVPDEMEHTYFKTIVLLMDAKNVEKFDYQEVTYTSKYGWGYGYGYYGGSKSWYYDDMIIAAMHNGKELLGRYYGASDMECLAQFLVDNPDVCYNEVTYVGDAEEFEELYSEVK